MSEVFDSYKRLERLIAQQAPQFAKGFRVLIAQMKKDLDLNVIADLLQRGRLEDAFQVALRRAPEVSGLYLNSYVAAAQSTATWLNRNLQNIYVNFDGTNPNAAAVMRAERLRLIREVSAAQRETTRAALTRGIQEGANPIQQARNFRDSLGLTRKQDEIIANYKRQLERGDRALFERALRDKRFDGQVRRAIERGEPLTRTQINRMVDRYRERFIAHRAKTIGRTEAMRAVHAGKEEMFRQAIEAGELNPENMTREWNTRQDNRLRDSHDAMHGQVIPFKDSFVSGKGNRAQNPGAFGVAEEDINCRCTVGVRIVQVDVPQGFSVEIS